uniref:Uncharacterized protein n=1 Tax=Siphoviridae sp. ctDsE1 TaxID=2825390 RepID=A0A8S5TYI3_9CAUD|nr:MAG TPA: hypothetical protein [Siphoviridae sp. ctDsE1]
MGVSALQSHLYQRWKVAGVVRVNRRYVRFVESMVHPIFGSQREKARCWKMGETTQRYT